MGRLRRLLIVTALVGVTLLALAAPALAETMPFQTLVSSPAGDSAVVGQTHSFGFWVFHPNPSAIVTSGQIVFSTSTGRKVVARVPITGLAHYVIETDWTFDGMSPPNVFTWSKVTLNAGTYRWHVLVTVNGQTNAMYDQGSLTVKRR